MRIQFIVILIFLSLQLSCSDEAPISIGQEQGVANNNEVLQPNSAEPANDAAPNVTLSYELVGLNEILQPDGTTLVYGGIKNTGGSAFPTLQITVYFLDSGGNIVFTQTEPGAMDAAFPGDVVPFWFKAPSSIEWASISAEPVISSSLQQIVDNSARPLTVTSVNGQVAGASAPTTGTIDNPYEAAPDYIMVSIIATDNAGQIIGAGGAGATLAQSSSFSHPGFAIYDTSNGVNFSAYAIARMP